VLPSLHRRRRETAYDCETDVIDLHCHILPGIDDGAPDLETSLAMARMAVADGITVTACTPHMMPGYYENTSEGVRAAVVALQAELDANDIPLRLVTGADVHLVPGLATGLREGSKLTLADSRYFLFEPPHNTAPPRMADAVFDCMAAGFHPLITHPERLRWIEDHYELMVQMAEAGAWMQITAGSITGRFGKRTQYWAERMVDEGIVHILATDAHNLRSRSPVLSEAVEAVAERLGEEAAKDMVLTRPLAVLENVSPATVPAAVGVRRQASRPGFFKRLFKAA
jgi:protein-tyrosine phosphatase